MNLINFLEVVCGTPGGPDEIKIPGDLANILHLIYNAIRIGVPIILILVGMFGLGKAITQQKEDEIKKAQSTLIKQAIAAGIVFLMFSLVSLLVSVVAKDLKTNSYWDCVEQILKRGDAETTSGTPSLETCNPGVDVQRSCVIDADTTGIQICDSTGHWTICAPIG